MTSPVERISGPRSVSTAGEPVEGQYRCSFTETWPSMPGTCSARRLRQEPLDAELLQGGPHHHPGGRHGDGHPGRLGHEGHRPAGPGVRLEHVDGPVLHRVLHVQQALDRKRVGQRPGVATPACPGPSPSQRHSGGSAHAESPEWMPASSTRCSITPHTEELTGAVPDSRRRPPPRRPPPRSGRRAPGARRSRRPHKARPRPSADHRPAQFGVVEHDLHGPAAQHVAGPHQHRVAGAPRPSGDGRPAPRWWPCHRQAAGCPVRCTGRSTARGPRQGRWRPGSCRARARAGAWCASFSGV